MPIWDVGVRRGQQRSLGRRRPVDVRRQECPAIRSGREADRNRRPPHCDKRTAASAGGEGRQVRVMHRTRSRPRRTTSSARTRFPGGGTIELPRGVVQPASVSVKCHDGVNPRAMQVIEDAWRRVPESNRSSRICNPLRNLSANPPFLRGFSLVADRFRHRKWRFPIALPGRGILFSDGRGAIAAECKILADFE